MNTTQSSPQASITPHNSARLAGFGLAVLMNLALLVGIDRLAQVDPQQAQMAQAHPAAAASSSQS